MIKLGTVRGRKDFVYRKMATDIEAMNRHYTIIPEYQVTNLYDDIKRLVFGGIADKFKLVFYNPVNPRQVYLEKSYLVSSFLRGGDDTEEIGGYDLPNPYEFDVFVSFTAKFQRLNSKAKEETLRDFNFSWLDSSKLRQSYESDAENKNFSGAREFEWQREQEKDGNNSFDGHAEPESDFSKYLESRAIEGSHNGSPETSFQVSNEPSKAGMGEDFGKQTRDNVQDIPTRAAHDKKFPLMKHFCSGKPFLIAAYSDSRQLIDEFINVSRHLGLKAVQWSYSEGFKALGDEKYFERYLVNDGGEVGGFTNVRMSPFEALRHIKNETRGDTVYLLEDFHYYLRAENSAGSDLAELISLLKSLPEVLSQVNSFVVVLAPTVELPPEISPIFEIVKNESMGRKFHYLERFGKDLTKLVLEDKVKPIIGRDDEILECLKTLSRMESNNPLLVGKSGVGKTAIVEGLAARLVKGNVPSLFAQKRLIALNLNAMVSGTKYRGEFEKRLEGLLEEVKSNAQKVIVFIDEIHTLLGMGGSEGATGAENILKPYLARGEFPCIGATTYDEYKKYIEPDRALARRFQVVHIAESDMPQTLKILRGIKHLYENHHQVTIHGGALDKCVELAHLHLENQFFPGKAIKMLDSACASASLAGKNMVTPELVVKEFDRYLSE